MTNSNGRVSSHATVTDPRYQFRKSKCIVVETYRKNGDPVRTPVWFVENGSKLFVMTREDSGKVKRIRNEPRTRVVPSSFTGEPKGVWVHAKAGFADRECSKIALGLMDRKYNILKWTHDLYSWILGRRYVVIELNLRGSEGVHNI